jgi:large subunit ribosomal protein L23
MSGVMNQKEKLNFCPRVFWDILKRPLVTEKATRCTEANQHVFIVGSDVTKDLVKHAVEKIFSVEVLGVNILNCRGKVKRFRGREGVRRGFKKAIVRLAEGQNLSSVLGDLS